MGRLHGLDALRGIAALLVVLGHADHLSNSGGWFAASYLAVDFFFLLSGYVLSRTFDLRLRGGLSPIDFMKLRLRRLWPVMAIGSTLGLLSFTQVLEPFATLALFLLALAFIPQMWSNIHPTFPSNPPAWSICAELVANLAHAVVLVRLSNLALASFASACFLALLALAPSMDVGAMPSNLLLGFARIGFSYSVGMLIWRKFGDREQSSTSIAIIVLPLSIIAASQLGPWFDFAFVALACPIILVAGIGPSRIGPSLGALSFPLYAVHYPIVWEVIINGGPKWFAVALALAAAAVVAFYFEPGIRSRNRADVAAVVQ